jgi:hypothetical protein
MRIAIRTIQAPTKGAGAWSPTLTFGGAPVTNGQNIVTGAPGTVRVPVSRPPAMDDSSLGGAYNQPSACAPNWILPSIYVAHANNSLRFPGKIKSDNPMPIPAINVTRTAAQTQHKTRIGGRTVTAAIRPFTTWPTYQNR